MKNLSAYEQAIHLALKPSPKQIAFMAAKRKHVAYGGARGGGKSWAVRAKAVLLALRYPGIKILIVRRTLTTLRNNHVIPLKMLLHGIATYNKNEAMFEFERQGDEILPSTIKFEYCDNESHRENFQGKEYDVIFIDEATQLQEAWIKDIQLTCRGANDFPKRIYYTMNPGGASHGYFKRIFIDKVFEEEENPDDYEFIQALVYDNKALLEKQPEYVQILKTLPPKLRKAWLEGDWDIFEGQFFEEFANRPAQADTRQWTHVIPAKDFVLPKTWTVYRSFDWGYNKPFSCGWWAVDYDGRIYRIAELYGVKRMNNKAIADEGVKQTPDMVFSRIAKMEKEHPLLAGHRIEYGVADPAIWDSQTGESIADTAAKYGIHFVKGDHQRIPGWMQCHYRLQFDAEGYPRMYVLDSCKDFIRTVPTLVYDEHNPEDLDTKGEDHAADEWRYFCMSRPIQPILEPGVYEPMYNSDPLNMF